MIAYVARGDSKYKVGESAPQLALRYEKSAKFSEVEKKNVNTFTTYRFSIHETYTSEVPYVPF